MAVGDVMKDVLVARVIRSNLYAIFPVPVDDVKELIGKVGILFVQGRAGGQRMRCSGVFRDRGILEDDVCELVLGAWVAGV